MRASPRNLRWQKHPRIPLPPIGVAKETRSWRKFLRNSGEWREGSRNSRKGWSSCGRNEVLARRRIPVSNPGLLSLKEVLGGIVNRHGVDGDVLHGTVPRTRGGIGNRIDDSQLTGHFAKDGVFAVEELCRLVGNEELAAIGIRTCIGHGELSGTIMATMREALILNIKIILQNQ